MRAPSHPTTPCGSLKRGHASKCDNPLSTLDASPPFHPLQLEPASKPTGCRTTPCHRVTRCQEVDSLNVCTLFAQGDGILASDDGGEGSDDESSEGGGGSCDSKDYVGEQDLDEEHLTDTEEEESGAVGEKYSVDDDSSGDLMDGDDGSVSFAQWTDLAWEEELRQGLSRQERLLHSAAQRRHRAQLKSGPLPSNGSDEAAEQLQVRRR